MPDADMGVTVPVSKPPPTMAPEAPAPDHLVHEGPRHEAGIAVERALEQVTPMDVDPPAAVPDVEGAGMHAAQQGQGHEPATPTDVAMAAEESPQPSAALEPARTQPENEPGEGVPHGAEPQQAAEAGSPAEYAIESPPAQQDQLFEQAAGVSEPASAPLVADQQQAVDVGTPVEHSAQPPPPQQGQPTEQAAGAPALSSAALAADQQQAVNVATLAEHAAQPPPPQQDLPTEQAAGAPTPASTPLPAKVC